MAQIQAEDSWVVVGSGGHYADACVRFGLAKPGQHLVVKFSQWNKWYNEQRWARVWIKPPTPAFCGETWEVANQIKDDLNNWKE